MARHPAPPFYRSGRPGRGAGNQRVRSEDIRGAASATGVISIAAGNAADADTVVVDASALGGPSVTFTFVPAAAPATGSITTIAAASLVDTETFTISDGTTSLVFEFDIGGGGITGDVAVVLAGAETADQVRDAIISAVNGAAFNVSAADGGAATVSLTNDNTGAAGNVVITETVANAGFIVSGMSGGEDGATADTEVDLGATNADSATNLAAKIDIIANGLDPYLLPTTTALGDVTVTAFEGSGGNSITLQATGANLTPVGATALIGGAEGAAAGAFRPNSSVPPLVYTNGIGERTLFRVRNGKVSAPDVDLD